MSYCSPKVEFVARKICEERHPYRFFEQNALVCREDAVVKSDGLIFVEHAKLMPLWTHYIRDAEAAIAAGEDFERKACA